MTEDGRTAMIDELMDMVIRFESVDDELSLITDRRQQAVGITIADEDIQANMEAIFEASALEQP